LCLAVDSFLASKQWGNDAHTPKKYREILSIYWRSVPTTQRLGMEKERYSNFFGFTVCVEYRPGFENRASVVFPDAHASIYAVHPGLSQVHGIL
jgi:hypothetical protein